MSQPNQALTPTPRRTFNRHLLAWAIFCLPWILVVLSGRQGWGAGTLGVFLIAVVVCFLGTVISAVSLAATTLAHFRSLPVTHRVVGILPLVATVLIVLLAQFTR